MLDSLICEAWQTLDTQPPRSCRADHANMPLPASSPAAIVLCASILLISMECGFTSAVTAVFPLPYQKHLTGGLGSCVTGRKVQRDVSQL